MFGYVIVMLLAAISIIGRNKIKDFPECESSDLEWITSLVPDQFVPTHSDVSMLYNRQLACLSEHSFYHWKLTECEEAFIIIIIVYTIKCQFFTASLISMLPTVGLSKLEYMLFFGVTASMIPTSLKVIFPSRVQILWSTLPATRISIEFSATS